MSGMVPWCGYLWLSHQFQHRIWVAHCLHWLWLISPIRLLPRCGATVGKWLFLPFTSNTVKRLVDNLWVIPSSGFKQRNVHVQSTGRVTGSVLDNQENYTEVVLKAMQWKVPEGERQSSDLNNLRLTSFTKKNEIITRCVHLTGTQQCRCSFMVEE